MIIIDTHIFVWLFLEPERVPANISAAIGDEDALGLSAISLWEIAMLTEKKRFTLPEPLLSWLKGALALDKLKLLPITPEIAATSAGLPMHGDPADRLIAATAIAYNVALATVDRLLLEMPLLKTIT
ncbi:MAG: type II toxin-antitoxin system VapC family toxin [Treponema sp.]|jgi:PIN domain nuclease of toxin-antitoxin system|nr:type II toxin-antitoxin system VapC family toxin [Treponema sp.]